jgi:hypothetical protein
MSEVLVDAPEIWETAKQDYTRRRRNQTAALVQCWYSAMQQHRRRCTFSVLVPGVEDIPYQRAVKAWVGRFDRRVHAPVPPLSAPSTASQGLSSLLARFRQVDQHPHLIARWVALHQKHTADIRTLAAETSRRLDEVRCWFSSVSGSWRSLVHAAPAHARQHQQRRSEFLTKLLPTDASEAARCFAESECMVSVAKLLCADADTEKTASAIDCESRALTSELQRSNDEHLRRCVGSARETVRVAAQRSLSIVDAEHRQVSVLEAAATAAAESIATAAQLTTREMRKLAHGASVESVPTSSRMHDVTDHYEKLWAFLVRERWMPANSQV